MEWFRLAVWAGRVGGAVARVIAILLALGFLLFLQGEMSVQIHFPQITFPWLGSWAPKYYWYPTFGLFIVIVLLALWLVLSLGIVLGRIFPASDRSQT